MCYGVVACVTDYDCWHETHESVTAEMIINTLLKNVETAKQIIKLAVKEIPQKRDCGCDSALSTAIVTDPKAMPEAQKKKLDLLIGKYVRKA